MRYLLLFVFLLAAPSILSATDNSVAVNDLKPQGLDSASAQIITDRLRNELFNTGVFNVIERGQMEAILTEQAFQTSDVCDEKNCAIQIGQLLGVKYIVVGSIGKLGKTFTMSVRMIDVGTAKIIHTANTDCRCEIDELLATSTVDIARKLAQGISPASAEAPQTAAVQQEASASPPPAPPPPPPPPPEIKKKRLMPKVVIGLTTVGFLAAGVVFDRLAAKNLNDASKIKTDFNAASSPTERLRLGTAYNDKISTSKSKTTLRNIFYGLAGAGAVGFAVSFAF